MKTYSYIKMLNFGNHDMSHGRLKNKIKLVFFSDQATLGRDQYTDWKENGAKWPHWWQALTFQTAGRLVWLQSCCKLKSQLHPYMICTLCQSNVSKSKNSLRFLSNFSIIVFWSNIKSEYSTDKVVPFSFSMFFPGFSIVFVRLKLPPLWEALQDPSYIINEH